jgi:hypothetical protein
MRNQIGISPTNWTEVTLAREFLVITVSYELQLAYEYLLWTPTCCKHDLKVRVLIQAFASDLLLKDRVTHSVLTSPLALQPSFNRHKWKPATRDLHYLH